MQKMGLPKYHTLCGFACEFPHLVAEFLNFDQLPNKKIGLPRRQVKEDSVTDIMVVLLKMLATKNSNIIVNFPDEPKTGADMRWNFVDAKSGTFFPLYIQAKRLHVDEKGGWKEKIYYCLFYKRGRKSQSETLIEEAQRKNGYPLYMFYNPEKICNLARCDKVHDVLGVNLVDGHIIGEFEKEHRGLKQKSTPAKCNSLENLHPHFFSLEDIFCCLHPKDIHGIPSPDAVCEYLKTRYKREYAIPFGYEFEREYVPEVSDEIPEYVNRILDKQRTGLIYDKNQSKDRKKYSTKLDVIFISSLDE